MPNEIQIIRPPRYAGFLFIALLIGIYIFIGYHEVLFSPPRSIHFVRQVDSLSFVIGYIRNGLRFFEPEVNSLNSINGKAACEFPVIYYFTALLYKLFGEHEFFLRLINLTIMSIGLYHLFRLAHLLLKDVVYAIGLTLLFLSSTVLLFYANNFLPDAAALGFTLSGWYFFYGWFYSRDNRKLLIKSAVFFTLASLIKVTYFINPLAALLALFTHDLIANKKIGRALEKNKRYVFAFCMSLLAVAAWYLYVSWYNEKHSEHYFLTHARPLWDMSGKEIEEALLYIQYNWAFDYLYEPALKLVLVLGATGFMSWNTSRMLLLQTLFLLLGGAAYVVLFFHQFHYHDYYVLALAPVFIFLALNGSAVLLNRMRFLRSIIPKIALIVLCCYGINYSRQRLESRNALPYGPVDGIAVKLKDGRDYMRKAGVPYSASVVVITDGTPNAGLYFLDRKGWNVHDTSAWSIQRTKDCIGWGAKYIVLTDRAYLQNSHITSCLGEKRLEAGDVLVYRARRPEEL